jgi:deoxyribose-phosphate aldolase
MTTDPKLVEALVEIVTREVLLALAEAGQPAAEGETCKFECADGVCVRTCFDKAGQVVSAGS